MNHESATPHLPGMVEAEHVQFRFPTRPDWIEPAVEFLRQRAVLCGACDEARAGRIMMGLHEAISNAIVHGNLEISSELKEQGDSDFAQELARRCADERLAKRSVLVQIEYDGAVCRWSITDEGNGFDVARVLQRDPTSGEEILLSSGRGLLLMRAFFDEVRYEVGGRRIVLSLRKESARRRMPRHETQHRVRIVPLRDDGSVDWPAAYDALARNLSTDGLAVLQAQLATATRILIGLDNRGQTLYVPAFVRHCRQMGGDFVELGCQFQSPAEPSLPIDAAGEAAVREIADIVERLQDETYPHDERRLHPRVAYTCPIQIAGGSEREPIIGFGRDLSKGGIAFVTTAPIPCETRLLTLPAPNGSPPRVPIRVSARIIRCDRIMSGFFDVGACFENAGSQAD